MAPYKPSSLSGAVTPDLSVARQKSQQAQQAIISGHYQHAIELAEEGLGLLGHESTLQDQAQVRFELLLERGRARVFASDYGAVVDFQEVYTNTPDAWQRLDAMIGIADCHSGTGNYGDGERQYIAVLEKAWYDEQAMHCIRSWIGLGNLYRKQGRTQEAIQTLNQAHELLQKAPDAHEMGRMLTSLGMAHTLLGELNAAITMYKQALTCFRTQQDQYQEIIVLDRLGELFQELGNLERAIQYHEEAITMAIEIEAERAEVNITRNIGVDLLLMGRYSDAMLCLDKALAVAREIGDPDLILDALYSLGDALLRQGKVKQIGAIIHELITEAAATGSGLHMTQAKLLQGRTHLACGDWEKAQTTLQDALAEAHSLSSRILLWQLHAALGRAALDPSVAQVHFRIAADFIQQTAESLTHTDLRTSFLKRPEVNAVLERAE